MVTVVAGAGGEVASLTFGDRVRSVELYNQQRQQFSGPNLVQPLVQPPTARAARDVITGTHRGRPFVAAVFDTYYQGENSSERCIWGRLPAARPALSVHKVAAAQSRMNEAIGRGDVRSGNPEFDNLFDVRSEDSRQAADLLSPALVDFVLANQRKIHGFMLFGDHLDVLDPVREHRDPAELIPALDLRCDLLDRISAALSPG